MACNSLGQRSISAVLALAAASFSVAQAFGRFGYDASNPVIGFEVDKQGFKVNHPAADKIRFESSSGVWKPLITNELSQTIGLSGIGRSPLKLRSNLLGVGFELYFHYGFAFRISTLSSPYVTWLEGSVGAGVPTPTVNWALVSFRDSQPPILLGFEGPTCAVQITGKSGQWILASTTSRDGWVRVVAPLGPVGFPTNSAADLGALVKRIKPDVNVLCQPIPQIVGISVADDPLGVVATWKFDRGGAVVPTPLTLAPLGGYPLKVQTPIRRLSQRNEYGPVCVSDGDTLTVRFPARRIPTGRSLSVGESGTPGPVTVSSFDIPSLVEIALYNLTCFRDPLARDAASQAVQEFLGEANYESEPFTDQKLPYAASGKGLDLVAAHALLMQAQETSEKASSEPNSLLTSVTWRRDWYTWRILAPDEAVARRSAAIAAIAAALCPEPERRLDAGMLQAGLVAERGYRVWLQRTGQKPPDQPLLETLEALRNALFAMEGTSKKEDAFLQSLQSEIRVYGPSSFVARKLEDRVTLHWKVGEMGSKTLVIASAYPLEVRAGRNVVLQSAEEALGFTVVRYSPAELGSCELTLKPPPWAQALPSATEIPRYSEIVR